MVLFVYKASEPVSLEGDSKTIPLHWHLYKENKSLSIIIKGHIKKWMYIPSST